MRRPHLALFATAALTMSALPAGTTPALDSDLSGIPPRHQLAREPAPAIQPPALAAAGVQSAEPTPLTDLVEEITARLQLPDPAEERIDQQYRWYARNPAYLERVFQRAQRYLPHIVRELDERGMPVDLALLPIVESAFDPFAYSHGRAAGLWQFIPATGKRYGLTQDWWYDGRRDVLASTDAALRYLEHLSRRFDGDWLLAVAAYNSGEGRVRGAVRRNQRAGKPTDFWHLRLPRETRAYVPKLLALGRILRQRYAEGLALPRISPLDYFEVVDTGGQIDLAVAAELAGITLDELYQLNPGFNRWATRPGGPHRLAVPIANAWQLRDALAALPASQRMRWQRVAIRDGDTLSTIAERHGVTVRALQQGNALRSTAIRAGQHLMIPLASAESAAYALSADGREARRLDANPSALRYTVKAGDSLWTIARAHGVSSAALARWNGMAPRDTLKVGRTLLIKGRTASVSELPTAPAGGPSGTRRRVAYTVRRGDSLARISQRFRVSVAELIRWNKLDQSHYLQPGQRLQVFVDVTRQSGG